MSRSLSGLDDIVAPGLGRLILWYQIYRQAARRGELEYRRLHPLVPRVLATEPGSRHHDVVTGEHAAASQLVPPYEDVCAHCRRLMIAVQIDEVDAPIWCYIGELLRRHLVQLYCAREA